ncbi:MAG: hypothetical protein ACX930_06920 [Erythrobacter sp.]
MITGCEDQAADEGTVETGGMAAGEVLGGTISDDMLLLEELTSTSPPAEPQTQSSTTTVSEGENGETVVETTVTTISGDSDVPTPAPPETPATPQ